MSLLKKIIQMRLDADILEWLKQAGLGYQTRANAYSETS
jgi:uncharacterized protein (DUF4415 family)